VAVVCLQPRDIWFYYHTVELKLNEVLSLVLVLGIKLQHQVFGMELNKLWLTFLSTFLTFWKIFLERFLHRCYFAVQVGRCLPVDYYVGCFADVLDHVELRCSGKSSCLISVPDAELFRVQPCRKDLVAYFEAAYRCVTGTRAQWLAGVTVAVVVWVLVSVCVKFVISNTSKAHETHNSL